MKIKKLESHDRLLSFQKEADLVSQGCDDCLKRNPISLILQSESPYVYIFAHPRTVGLDEKVDMVKRGMYKRIEDCPEKYLLWQPRLTKPIPQENSYCFRAISHTDQLEVCWIIPPREMWEQYSSGKMTHSEIVLWSIDQFLYNFKELSSKFKDDLPDDKIRMIYLKIAEDMKRKKSPMLDSLEVFLGSLEKEDSSQANSCDESSHE